MKKILIPLLLILTLPLTYAHMPPKDQALIIVKEADGYKFEFLIFPKRPETGAISELVLNVTYLKDGRPYIGGVKMRVEALEVNISASPPFDILEFGAEKGKKDEGNAIQFIAGQYEITVIYAANGTYAVEAWLEGERTKLARAEFMVYPRSKPNLLLFGFLGLMVLVFLAVGYSFSKRRG